jgi:hypothetical protein
MDLRAVLNSYAEAHLKGFFIPVYVFKLKPPSPTAHHNVESDRGIRKGV